jgi:DNA-binding transcriptional regulator GbsR (MarR family)
MAKITLKGFNQLIRFFEKQVEWLGLSRNTGPVLAVLYLSKYKDKTKLSAEEISEATSYSRSNIGLILSQLEALGLVYGEIDYDQTGRGRRRILYTIEEGVKSLLALGIKMNIDKLEESLRDMKTLKEIYKPDAPYVAKMMDDFRGETKSTLAALKEVTSKTVKR